MWPEFSGLFFNVVEGKSAEWGVSEKFKQTLEEMSIDTSLARYRLHIPTLLPIFQSCSWARCLLQCSAASLTRPRQHSSTLRLCSSHCCQGLDTKSGDLSFMSFPCSIYPRHGALPGCKLFEPSSFWLRSLTSTCFTAFRKSLHTN